MLFPYLDPILFSPVVSCRFFNTYQSVSCVCVLLISDVIVQVNKRIVKNMKTINFSDRTSNREKLIINQFITVKAVILFHLLSFGCLPNEFEIDDRGAHSITGSRCEGAENGGVGYIFMGIPAPEIPFAGG